MEMPFGGFVTACLICASFPSPSILGSVDFVRLHLMGFRRLHCVPSPFILLPSCSFLHHSASCHIRRPTSPLHETACQAQSIANAQKPWCIHRHPTACNWCTLLMYAMHAAVHSPFLPQKMSSHKPSQSILTTSS